MKKLKLTIPKIRLSLNLNPRVLWQKGWSARPQLSASRIQAVLVKELTSFIYAPASYVIIAVFLIVAYILFFGNFFSLGMANLNALFDVYPWLIMLVTSALGMGLLAGERKEGTLEYLLTQPLQIGELIIGKYLALLTQATICVLSTLPLLVGVSTLGRVDIGIAFAQYLSSLVVAAIFSGVSILVSSLVKNQIAAFLGTMLVSFVLLFSGSELFTRNVPLFIAGRMESLSVLSHYMSMARGAIDMRDLIYAVSLVALFLLTSRLVVMSYKYPIANKVIRRGRVHAAIFAIVFVTVALVGEFIPGRIDLTSGGIYTISKATTDVVRSLPDKLELNVYLSNDLPPQFQPQIRDIRNLVREYQLIGGSNLQVSYKYIDGSNSEEARSAGVQETQFNVVGNNELQVKSGYLGVQLKYQDKSDVIAFVQNTDELEYDLTSRIAKLTNTSGTKVLLMAPAASATGEPGFTTFLTELQKTLDAQSFSFGADNKIPEDTALLVILGLDQPLTDAQLSAIKDYFKTGGRIILAQNSIEVVPTAVDISASSSDVALRTLFSDWGVTVATKLAYDLQRHETVATTNGGARTLSRYPFWIIANPTDDLALTQQLDGVLLPWASQLEVSSQLPAKTKVTNVLETSEFAGSQFENFNVAVTNKFNEEGLTTMPLLVEISQELSDGKVAKALVAGDSDFLNDQFVDYKQNLGFGLRMVEWLTQANSLSEIKVKDRSGARISGADSSLLKYFVPAISLITVAAAGYVLISKRSQREHESWVASEP